MIVNEEDPVKAQLVNDRINALLAQANLVIAKQIADEGGKYLGLIINGGEFTVLGQRSTSLGCNAAPASSKRCEPALPPGPLRDSLDQVTRSPTLAHENLGIAGTPDQPPGAADRRSTSRWSTARSPPLEVFAIAVAATFTLAFVTVLLVAGSLALEREENAFPRLTRGLVSARGAADREGAARGRGRSRRHPADARRAAIFVPLHWGRFGLWLLAIARRRRGPRSGRGGARRRGTGGPGRLPARLHGHPAGRLPLADPLRHGRPGALRRDQGDRRALPLQAGAARR